MTNPPISQQVQQWLTQLTTISRNLMDLAEAEPTRLIRARVGDAAHGFSGVTQAQAARAVVLLDNLLEQYAQLAYVVEEAHGLVAKGGLFRNNEERVRDLLTGQSVALVAQRGVMKERGLLDDGNRVERASPAEVLTSMERSFAEARAVFASISDALAQVRPQMAKLRQEITSLTERGQRLGVPSPTTLPDIDHALTDGENDPIGSAATLATIAASIARWQAAIAASEAERQTTLAAIAQGYEALTQLQALAVQAATTFAEVQAEIVDPAGLVPPPADDAIASLAAWLSTLAENAASGRFAAVKVGMVKWEHDYSNQMSLARASYMRASALLDERADLRGRFTALRAKADALRSRGSASGAALATAAQRTKGVLDTSPFDINAARVSVATFEAAVAAASHA